MLLPCTFSYSLEYEINKVATTLLFTLILWVLKTPHLYSKCLTHWYVDDMLDNALKSLLLIMLLIRGPGGWYQNRHNKFYFLLCRHDL
jgi:hypothetical protein